MNYIFLMGALLCTGSAFASTTAYMATWVNLIYLNHFQSNPDLLYGLSLEGRFKNQPGLFYQSLATAQLGYRLSERASGWIGYAALPTVVDRNISHLDYDQYLFQQVVLDLFKTAAFQMTARARIDEFKHASDTQLGLIYRQLFIWDFLNLKIKDKYTPFLSNEIFLNINKPTWGSKKTLNQNRFMAGVSFTCAGSHTYQLAYLNQYEQGPVNNSVNHIFYFSFII